MVYTLLILAWFLLGKIVYDKQYKAENKHTSMEGTKGANAWLAAIFAPLTVILYAIRAVFFEDWI